MFVVFHGDSFHVIGFLSFADESLVTPLGPATGDSSRTASLSLLGEEVTEITSCSCSWSGLSSFWGSSISKQWNK